jgi:hypothetical protein
MPAASWVSLSVTAAYRTARHGPGTVSSFESGPQILLSPEWIDVIPVVLGLGLFLLQRTLLDKQWWIGGEEKVR